MKRSGMTHRNGVTMMARHLGGPSRLLRARRVARSALLLLDILVLSDTFLKIKVLRTIKKYRLFLTKPNKLWHGMLSPGLQ